MVFKRSQSGEAMEILGTAEDITERIEATEALIANEERFRRLVETTKVIPFEIDLKTARFSYVGPQAEQFLGYRLHQWYGAGFWHKVIHPEDIARAFPEGSQESVRGEDRQTDFRVRAANGSLLWVRQILHFGGEENPRSVARGFLLDITDSKQLEEDNEESKRQLRALAQRNVSIREEERVRVAHEIHDELGQALTIIRIDLAWMTARLSPADGRVAVQPVLDKIRAMEALADSTLTTVRRIATALRPPVLDELGLGEAIEWQAEEFARRVGLECEVRAQYPPSGPPEAAIVVFRVFQEILTNIARHARATKVRISLYSDDKEIALIVSDNGCGINVDDLKGGSALGILGMKERVSAVEGTLRIKGTPGKGTTICVNIPVKPSSGA
jgi:PAS domain S-box-containing protein